MIGTKLPDGTLLGMLIHEKLTQQMREVARIDLHGAGGSAETVGGTGLLP